MICKDMKTILTLCWATAIMLMSSCGDTATDYDAIGVFETTEVIVSAKAGGEIMRLDIDEGEEVDHDAVLGYIDTVQTALKKEQLLATLSATGSKQLDKNRQLASIKQQISNLQHEHRRFSKLLESNAATQKQVDDIEQQIEIMKRQLSATEEQIGSSNNSLTEQSASIVAQIGQLDDMLRNSLITSPITGTVLAKYAEQGEYAVPGRALFKVGDIKKMKLRAYITAGQLTTLRLGQKAKVYADLGESGKKEYEGVVSWISDEAEFTPKTIQTRTERSNLVYAIKVSVVNDGIIKRGMYGDVKF